MRVEEGFQPVPFVEGNPYTTDPVLPSLLRRVLPQDAVEVIGNDLERFGGDILTTLRALSAAATPPELIQYNSWGQRVDELRTSEGWRRLKDIYHQEGIVAIPYERKFREHSRTYAFAKIFLASGDSAVIDCPMSMTDGVARVIELCGSPAMKQDIFPRLISRDPAVAFTAGQWMTERTGGSDVSQTETTATPAPAAQSAYGPSYTLDGFKWFSSATDSDVALALARTSSPARGLSLFLVPLRLPLLRPPTAPRPPALSNNILIHRLKNKLGTRALPTAELALDGAAGWRLGAPGAGVRLVAPVLNITRAHSAVGSVGYLRKCLAIASAHARGRAIRGGALRLCDAPLHVAELARVHVLYRALVHFVFGAVGLLGKVECGVASEEEALRLRLLTPAIKAFAAEKAVAASEECMAALGGEGYMEENGIGRCIQDGLVERIWEGTTTVLSLDIVRAVTKSNAMDVFVSWGVKIMSSCPGPLAERIAGSITSLKLALTAVADAYTLPMSELVARPALFLFSHVASSLYLLEHASWAYSSNEPTANTDIEVFRRWVDEGGLDVALQNVAVARGATSDRIATDFAIVYGEARRARL